MYLKSKSSPKKEVNSNIGLPQVTEKFQINNLTLCLKELGKEEQAKPKVNRRKMIIRSKQK